MTLLSSTPESSAGRPFLLLAFPILLAMMLFSSQDHLYSRESTGCDSTEQKVWIHIETAYLTARIEKEAISPRARRRIEQKSEKKNYIPYLRPTSYADGIINKNTKKITFFSKSLRAYCARVTPSQKIYLAQCPFVKKIEPVKKYRCNPVIPKSRPIPLAKTGDNGIYGNSYAQLEQINIIPAHTAGLSGEGVLIALFDTGFYKDHCAFQRILTEGRLIAERDFIFNDANTQDENALDSVSYYNQSDHGTSVWSVIGGYDPETLIGAACGADFLLAKTERLGSESIVEEDNFVAAVEWADSAGADIISSSLAYRDFDNPEDDYHFEDLDGQTTKAAKAVNWAFDRGILVISAVGNFVSSFPEDGGLHTPADAIGALGIGAVDIDNQIASFCSHGPTADGRIKPDLCALGVNTFVASDNSPTQYAQRNGTSFATPLISGAAALLMEHYPEFTPAMIITLLKKWASRTSSPDHIYGWGIPDIARSLADTNAFDPFFSIHRTEIRIFPNPANHQIRFYFSWSLTPPMSGPVKLVICDLTGRTVWQTGLQAQSSGLPNILIWNGRDANHCRISSGVYIAYLQEGRYLKKAKFTILR